mgnify:CR=1 FL=1
MRSFVAAFRFLTRLPVPGPETRLEDLAPAVGWFPLVGAMVGFLTVGAYWGARHLWEPPVAAVVAIAFGLLVTGGFHEDGLTDATDGLGGGWSRERVLEIMKDSRIGAYGAMALWCLLALRWATLAQLDARALGVLPLVMVFGRWSISVILVALPPIGQGLAKEVHGRGQWRTLVHASLILVVALAIAAVLRMPGLVAMGAAAAGTVGLWILYLRHRLGGHSGDLLGAGSQLVESAVLLAALARA